jgi:hypothetical protein
VLREGDAQREHATLEKGATVFPAHARSAQAQRGAACRHGARASHGVSSGPKMVAPHTNRFSSLCGDALQPCAGTGGRIAVVTLRDAAHHT